jgi:exopolysaccharide biosynthesis polyprenyl glycosylphosphotransferase
MAIFAGTGLVIGLWVIALLVRRFRSAPERVLFLGNGPLVPRLAAEVAADDRRFRIAGVVDNSPTAERMTGGVPWIGASDQLNLIIDRVNPARIVLTMSERRGRLPEAALLRARLNGVAVEDGLDFYERVSGKLAIETLSPTALIMAGGFRRLDIRPRGFWRRCSRAIECLTSAVALALLSPFIGLIAILIKLDSHGAVFFVQSRVGASGRQFGLVKFRTMHACDGDRSEWVRDNTDRVTRVGIWLRRFRIDEWPQLVNVLRGEMSFVGPRPHPASNYQLFLREIPYYHLRELVRPGITGWAQVRYGYANDLVEETEKMRFDIYYIKHRSLWLDVRILGETMLLLLFDRQSHQAPRKRGAESWANARRMVRLG